LQEWISHSNITSEAKPEIGDTMRSQFQAEHTNDNIFIDDLAM